MGIAAGRTLALVAMPWNRFDMPSPAVGALAAVVRESQPDWSVDCLSEYVAVWDALRERYEDIALDDRLGELIYAAHLYPERRDRLTGYYAQWASRRGVDAEPGELEWILDVTGAHIEDVAARLAGGNDVVGFTTSYCQLFPSLAVARRLRELSPETCIVLGGMGVAYEIGRTVLDHYGCVDVIVQGEGEPRLVALLKAVAAGEHIGDACGDGLLTRHKPTGSPPSSTPARSVEVDDLDALPVPDYSDYAEIARGHRIRWVIPVEASRGCWWDRVTRTGDRLKTCYFCSLNNASYRHKSVERVAEEVRIQSERYERVELRFLDNIIRHRGVEALAAALAGLGKDLSFFYELRAQLHPRDLLALREAGCDTVQIGIEGLSSDYLKRIGKGTRTIQNLQAMRTCYELGIYSGSNLLIRFPGTTQAEVDETEAVIRRYAVAYQPLDIAEFGLYLNSAVHRVPERFGVENLRNADDFAVVLPDSVLAALQLYWLDYDLAGPQPDWSGVKSALEEWRELHRRLTLADGTEWFLGTRPLAYHDGGPFIEIVDRRRGLDMFKFREPWRSIYLFCTEIRSLGEVAERFAGDISTSKLELGLRALAEEADLMFAEGQQVLSLAVAARPEVAARRIASGAEASDSRRHRAR